MCEVSPCFTSMRAPPRFVRARVFVGAVARLGGAHFEEQHAEALAAPLLGAHARRRLALARVARELLVEVRRPVLEGPLAEGAAVALEEVQERVEKVKR